MPRSCCVKGCGRRKIAGARLFSVPMGIKSAARRRIWLELLEIPEEKHNKKMEVCEKHFCKEDFNFGFLYSVNRDLRLKDRAIPHLHLSGGHHFRCTYEGLSFIREMLKIIHWT
ncbi:hypothetical protein Zmor_007522 [Zophobas morio]|uniref:THAP-type domain-containing protein n=1 Tax=Zophobas morio TaxID=2755281 RepID=A0AA38MPQ4_9CUCU|nr:hypothetical protein Zmor_007522 [Zophobas morio]